MAIREREKVSEVMMQINMADSLSLILQPLDCLVSIITHNSQVVIRNS